MHEHLPVPFEMEPPFRASLTLKPSLSGEPRRTIDGTIVERTQTSVSSPFILDPLIRLKL